MSLITTSKKNQPKVTEQQWQSGKVTFLEYIRSLPFQKQAEREKTNG